MKKGAYKNKIIEACKAAGTYAPHFENVIKTLAEILEKRDEVAQVYKDLGNEPIIAYTNKGGATNFVKNPALVMWDDLNKSALAYWRDLGLTPAGLKKITGDNPSKAQKGSLAAALKDIGI